ncbi:hypothetical protein PBY51_010354 [Eleginops maclovinus]|uniref:Uncharacterized protein n=1 Tax=Eleginops maclovinus TaxID=56733 RepID=A0AAN7X6B8_ELEMC|nr:hypothetical protein PBY51_010354 [Eleginops maclovinus]
MLSWGYKQVGGILQRSVGGDGVGGGGAMVGEYESQIRRGETGGGHDLWYQGVILGSLEHYVVDLSYALSNQPLPRL